MSIKYEYVVVHFGELWLKGDNRINYIYMLVSNIKNKLKSSAESVEVKYDRLLIKPKNARSIKVILHKLSYVFGISWYAPVKICSNDMLSIMSEAAKLIDKKKPVSIKIKRADKTLAFNSIELLEEFKKNREKFGIEMDKEAEQKLYIEMTKFGSFIHTEKYKGIDGLPVGSSGKAVVLLSGGIDSPVAAYYAMKRGLQPIYLHIHGFPTNEEAAKSKISLFKDILSRYSDSIIYFAKYSFFQIYSMKIDSRYSPVLFKRFAIDIAKQIMKEEKAQAIVSGESLGQVASQTSTNMLASEYDQNVLVIRPLICFNKQEIISKAKEIGTFNISIIKYKDVCSFNAAHPIIKSDPTKVERLYKMAKLDEAAERSRKEALKIQWTMDS
ncbi:MAG: tRNA uracil 4-sulfurtransferase ThiI [Candidatus Micrarchaeia archaeon]